MKIVLEIFETAKVVCNVSPANGMLMQHKIASKPTPESVPAAINKMLGTQKSPKDQSDGSSFTFLFQELPFHHSTQ